MQKSDQLSKIWENEFGKEYTDRKLQVHETEGGLRKLFWKELVQMVPDARTYLEIGCNAGMNLDGIYDADPKLTIKGIEPNKYALEIADKRAKGRYIVTCGNVFDLSSATKADLVFTCTVLIHIAPVDLHIALQKIYDSSNKYILMMEYYWPQVKEIKYRGLTKALWKQDFGALMMRTCDVELIETGYLGPRDGFDRNTWWLFKK